MVSGRTCPCCVPPASVLPRLAASQLQHPQPHQFWNLEPKISWPPTLHSQPNPKFGFLFSPSDPKRNSRSRGQASKILLQKIFLAQHQEPQVWKSLSWGSLPLTMAAPLYDLTSLPSTLSTIPLSSPSASSSMPSSSSLTPLLASSPEAVEGGQQQQQQAADEGEQSSNGSSGSKPPPSFLSLRSLRPGIRGLRGVQGEQVTAFLHSPQVGIDRPAKASRWHWWFFCTVSCS